MTTRSGSTFFSSLLVLACSCNSEVTVASSSASESSDSSTGVDPSTSTTAETSGMVTSATTGVDTSGGSSDTSSSTGISADCGNGTLDDGEECDDGDNDDGDACHADCTNAFDILWTVTHDGPVSGADAISDLAVDADGNVYALGGEATMHGVDVWLQQYLPDGSEGWTFGYDGAFSGDDAGTAMAFLPDGDMLVVGNSESADTGTDILVLRIDGATRAVEWAVTADGPGGPDDSSDFDVAHGLALTADGGVVVTAEIATADQHDDTWVARYDADGNQLWSATYDDDAHLDNHALAALVGSDETIYVFCQDYVNAMSTGRVLVYDGDGAPQGDPQAFDLAFTNAVWDSAGNMVVTGFAAPTNTGFDVITRKYDTDLAMIWEATFDGANGFDFPHGLQIDASDNVYVVGSMQRTGEQDNAFVEVYDADGNAWWGDEYNDDVLNIAEEWRGVAIDSTGDVLVGGYAPMLGQQADTFLRKYHPH